VIPKPVATASASGIPNITYVSAVHRIDDERLALSNQFLSKTARNLAENPRLSLMLIDPVTVSEFRLTCVFERTERRGPVFDRLRREVDDIAALAGMSDTFRLRAADIFRIERIEVVNENDDALRPEGAVGSHPTIHVGRLGLLAQRLSRCVDVEQALDIAVEGLHTQLGYTHSMVFVLDDTGARLVALASRGFATQGVGAEVPVGDGAAGVAAQRAQTIKVTDLQQMHRYARNVQRAFDGHSTTRPGPEIELPRSVQSRSRLAVPAISRGHVVGVVVVESAMASAFDEDDEHAISVVASILAGIIELEHDSGDQPEPVATAVRAARQGAPATRAPSTSRAVQVRFFEADGSVFLGDDYLIRGVAGRVLWSMLRRFERSGSNEVTLKELRLDKSLELSGFRDNLDTRVVLLKRRLEEHDAPFRIHRPGRGRITIALPDAFELVHHP
jgi:putative methionine-R-sulfoxide reductase with GAF domain